MKSTFSILLFICPLLLICQTVPKFNLEEVATIEVPTAMELQDKAYQKDAQPYYDQHGFVPVPGRAVFQQSGVNERKKEALALYARIIHETMRGNSGDFPSLGVDPEMGPQDLKEIDEMMRGQLKAQQAMGITVTKWLGTDIEK